MLDEKHAEVIETTEHSPAFNPTRTSAVHYDYIMNGYGLSPNYIQNIVSWQKVGAVGAGGYGAYRLPLPGEQRCAALQAARTAFPSQHGVFYLLCDRS